MPIPRRIAAAARARLDRAFRATTHVLPGLELDTRAEEDYLYIGLRRPGEGARPLCRLRWCGDPEDWDLEPWSPISSDYDRSTAEPIEGGTPEACLAAMLRAASLDASIEPAADLSAAAFAATPVAPDPAGTDELAWNGDDPEVEDSEEEPPPDRAELLDEVQALLAEVDELDGFFNQHWADFDPMTDAAEAFNRRKAILRSLAIVLSRDPLLDEELCGAADLLYGTRRSLSYVIPDLLDTIPPLDAAALDDLPFGPDAEPFWVWALRWSAGGFPTRDQAQRIVERGAAACPTLGALVDDCLQCPSEDPLDLRALATFFKLFGALGSDQGIPALLRYLEARGRERPSLDTLAVWALSNLGAGAVDALAAAIQESAAGFSILEGGFTPRHLSDLALDAPAFRSAAVKRLRSWLEFSNCSDAWKGEVCLALMDLGERDAYLGIRAAVAAGVCGEHVTLALLSRWKAEGCAENPSGRLLLLRPVVDTFPEPIQASVRRWEAARSLAASSDIIADLLAEEGWDARPSAAEDRQLVGLEDEPQAGSPVFEPRVARNAPCPCGSGKKYKKCCLPKDEAGRGFES